MKTLLSLEACAVEDYPASLFTMHNTDFYVTTAMLCYNYERTAVMRLKETWRAVSPAGQEEEVLDVVFVTCALCRALPHVHNPAVSTHASREEVFHHSFENQEYGQDSRYEPDVQHSSDPGREYHDPTAWSRSENQLQVLQTRSCHYKSRNLPLFHQYSE